MGYHFNLTGCKKLFRKLVELPDVSKHFDLFAIAFAVYKISESQFVLRLGKSSTASISLAKSPIGRSTSLKFAIQVLNVQGISVKTITSFRQNLTIFCREE